MTTPDGAQHAIEIRQEVLYGRLYHRAACACGGWTGWRHADRDTAQAQGREHHQPDGQDGDGRG